MEVNNGMRLGERRLVAEHLQSLLANLYALGIKTHNYHWNVTGQSFKPMHELFGEQYGQLLELADTVAERIRQLGVQATVTAQDIDRAFVKITSDSATALSMVARLTKDHEEIVTQGRDAIKIAEQNQDMVTADLIVGILTDIEKMAWMLRASKHDTDL